MRIIILGGGFGGVAVYERLRAQVSGEVGITLINKHNFFWFTPMLHEVATGSVSREHVSVPLRSIVKHQNDSFIRSEVSFIDVGSRTVHTSCGHYEYDQLVIALGSKGTDRGVRGVMEHAFQFRFIEDGVRLRNHVIARFEEAARVSSDGEREDLLRFAIVGGGLTGSELAAQLADWCKDLSHVYRLKASTWNVVLIHGGPVLVPQLHEKSSIKTREILKKKGVEMIFDARVEEVNQFGVVLADGRRVEKASVIWTAGFASPMKGLITDDVLDEGGWIKTTQDGRVAGFLDVWAVGDAAHAGAGSAFPQSAQAAGDIGKQVADNIIAHLQDRATKPLTFVSKGNLVPLGDWQGIAELGNLRFSGWFAWWMRRTVFIMRLPTWRDRFGVMFDWTLRIFGARDSSEWM